MWYTLLPKILNMSLTGSMVILVVLMLRCLLKCAPKLFSYMLWALVLFRLLCPVAFSSPLSALGVLNAPVSSRGAVEYISPNIVHTENPSAAPSRSDIGEATNSIPPAGEEQLAADPLEAPMMIAASIWIVGVAVMLVCSLINLIKLRRKLVGAAPLRENIYLADHIGSAFVLGLFFPKIYLPSTLKAHEQGYILQHESCHIRRGDHIVKVLAFAALCIHWFNPLVWAAFVLAGKDMEMSCDEAVMRKMGNEIRPDYAQSLLHLTTGRRIIGATPLAFGEGSTKARIKNVLNYKKPTFYIIAAAAIALLIVAACFLTNPRSRPSMEWARNLNAENIESIELVVLSQPENQQYKLLSNEEFADVAALINESHGKYMADPEDLAGSTILFYLKTVDGVAHVVRNLGNAYLMIDDDRYDAGYLWLTSWGKTYGVGNSALPENFFHDKLTLDDVLELSQKGMALGWADFDGFAYMEMGSGVYIRSYEINEMFSLWIGGGSTDEAPLYIRLISNTNYDDYVEIRTGNVEAYIAAHEETASTASGIRDNRF